MSSQNAKDIQGLVPTVSMFVVKWSRLPVSAHQSRFGVMTHFEHEPAGAGLEDLCKKFSSYLDRFARA